MCIFKKLQYKIQSKRYMKLYERALENGMKVKFKSREWRLWLKYSLYYMDKYQSIQKKLNEDLA